MEDKKLRYIIIDTLGGDAGPEVVTLGGVLALKEFDNLFVTFIGPKEIIENKLKELDADMSRLEIIDAKETITNYDNPVEAIYKKQDSSLVKALKLIVSDEKYIGLLTAGSSGAILMGSYRYCHINATTRPCMASLLPSENGSFTCLLDTGATIDCTKGELIQFAHMGSDFMRKLYGIESPKVGLLSNGMEASKGNKLVKETHLALKEEKDINFIGNVEGNKALSGICDVLVADGFAGNQVLKVTEGTCQRLIKDIVVYSKKNNKPEFMEIAQYLMKQYDISTLAGAIVLGIKKPIIKCRGNSNEMTFVNTARMLLNVAEGETIIKK